MGLTLQYDPRLAKMQVELLSPPLCHSSYQGCPVNKRSRRLPSTSSPLKHACTLTTEYKLIIKLVYKLYHTCVCIISPPPFFFFFSHKHCHMVYLWKKKKKKKKNIYGLPRIVRRIKPRADTAWCDGRTVLSPA